MLPRKEERQRGRGEIKEEKNKRSVESLASGVSCVSVPCNSVFEIKVRGPERLSNLGKVTYIRCFTC